MKNEEWLSCFTVILFKDELLGEYYHLVVVPSEIKNEIVFRRLEKKFDGF